MIGGAVLIAAAVLVAAYFVLLDKKEDNKGITEDELKAFGATLYDEDKMVVLHDVTTLEGVPFGNSDIPEKYTLLYFWASWCPDCKKETPSLQRLYDARAGETFTILAISIDTNLGAAKSYLETNEYDFPVLINLKNNLWVEYFPEIPTCFVLSPDGYIIAKIVPPENSMIDWYSEETLRILDYLMSLR
jgi:thiol-disulfide isomerase/thioredoxin